jgi:hypothetical protein
VDLVYTDLYGINRQAGGMMPSFFVKMSGNHFLGYSEIVDSFPPLKPVLCQSQMWKMHLG